MRDPSGNYSLPTGPNSTGNPVHAGDTIFEVWANTTMNDLAAALTDSLSRSGKGGMNADLAMAGYRVRLLGPAQGALDAPNAQQVRNQAFSWLGAFSDSTGNNYTIVSPPLATPLPLIDGTRFQFLADKDNTGPMTLAVGATPVGILVNGGATPPGLVRAGTVVEVTYASGSYRIVTVTTGGSTINTIESADAQVITTTNTASVGTIIPHTNVANGLVKLDSNIKVPVSLLPFTDLHFIGTWNAGPGLLPTVGGNGDFYVIIATGTLTLLRQSGGNAYTPQATVVNVGDAIIRLVGSLDTTNFPNGWYYDPGGASASVTASNVSMVQSSANPPFAGITNAQSWMNAADPAILARLLRTGDALTGPLLQPLAPGSNDALTNKLYVDGKVSALAGAVVSSFNARLGAVTLTSADVSTALGYTPANKAGDTFGGPIIAPSINVLKYIISSTAAGQSSARMLTLTAPVTFTGIINVPEGGIFRLILIGTANAVVWPAYVVWPLGVAPNLAAGPLKKAVVVLTRQFDVLLASATMY